MATAIYKTAVRSPLKSVFFLFAPVRHKGYVEREIALPSLEKEGGTFQGSLCSPLKSGGFGGTVVCTGKGYVGGSLRSLCSSERGYLFRACFAHLSKQVVFCGTFGCTGKGYVERGEEGTFQGSLCSPLKSGGFLWHFWVHR